MRPACSSASIGSGAALRQRVDERGSGARRCGWDDIQQNQRVRALRGFVGMHHQALAARGELPVNAFQLVAILPGADVFRDAVVGQRALSRRALAFAGADGERERSATGSGRTATFCERAPHGTAEGKQAETIRNRQLRNADREKRRHAGRQIRFRFPLVPKSPVESQKSLCLPPGSSIFNAIGAMTAGRPKRTRR